MVSHRCLNGAQGVDRWRDGATSINKHISANMDSAVALPRSINSSPGQAHQLGVFERGFCPVQLGGRNDRLGHGY
jgi:hypothetical protein